MSATAIGAPILGQCRKYDSAQKRILRKVYGAKFDDFALQLGRTRKTKHPQAPRYPIG